MGGLEFKTTKVKWMMDQDGAWLYLLHPDRQQVQEFVLSQSDKGYDVKISEHREKRSLDANAYAWSLINQIGNRLGSSKDEVYVEMLRRYGQNSVVSVVEEAATVFEKSIKYWEEIGESKLNGKNFIHIRVFTGSSSYDTKEMSILIDGIVSEAKELGIETMTPDEIEQLKRRWENA